MAPTLGSGQGGGTFPYEKKVVTTFTLCTESWPPAVFGDVVVRPVAAGYCLQTAPRSVSFLGRCLIWPAGG